MVWGFSCGGSGLRALAFRLRKEEWGTEGRYVVEGEDGVKLGELAPETYV